MKGMVLNLLFGLLLVTLCAGCSKQPVQEINAAKSAVDAAVSEGSEKYAPAESQKVNEELDAALNEVRSQDGKFLFRDYKKSVGMLQKVKADADVLKSGLDAKKAEARENARKDFEAARAAVDAAKSDVTKMPKRLSVETETIVADIKGLDESLSEAQRLIDTGDYLTASDRAGDAKEKATGISEEIRQATEKPGPKKTKGR